MRRDIPPADTPQQASVIATSLELLRRPWILLELWNWKAAVLSICLRVPIFLTATLRRGWIEAVSAVVAECIFCAASAGFFGAIVQLFRLAQPQWLALLLLTVILPALFQALEYVLHWTRGTPHLRLAEIASAVVSILSTLFNWYIMRRNTLLVGPEGRRFSSDLARLPRLLLNFITALPRRWLERHKSTQSSCAI
jgi:hypothetical protein